MAVARASFSLKATAPKTARVSAQANLKPAGIAAAAAASVVLGANSALAGDLTADERASLTYLQVKGTGLANTCATVKADDKTTDIAAGTYALEHLCLEPTAITVKEEDTFLSTKLMTRLTYTLDEISGKATVGSDGSFSFQEQDGIDYAPTTVQLPGGERVPFLFTVKELDAKGSLASFGGDFTVPSYRGSSFLDPKGRGGSLGRDAAKALPAASTADEYEKENIKETTPLAGSIVFNTAKVDATTGEIAGIFESIQPSDTDLGSKAPKDVKIEGVFYAQLE
mmetsp:Transcript_9273/g.37964  ORF Transcript_9273/g.37964 Transcript_9273/m.37964 type:complete len:283 (-) Transcript_9273:32-880(-)